MKIGDRIKQRRKELGYSVEEVAEKLGKNRATIYRYENNEIENFPVTVLEPLAKVLKTTPAYLMGWGIIGVGNGIKKERELQGYSLKELSQELGIPESELAAYESGIEPISKNLLKNICEIFGITIAKLVLGDRALNDIPLQLLEHYQELGYDENEMIDAYLEFRGVEREDVLRDKEKTKGVKIPVLGTIAAGIPIEAVEDVEDYEEISSELSSTGEFFALRIKGESMEPKFSEGDVVIVRKQEDIESGEIGVVIVNGSDATVKKVMKEDNGIMLVGTNPQVYSPKFYNSKQIVELPIKIIGKVIELRAKF
ncbi:MAG: XRE family transcriptional regulator [Bacillota bacterium]|nr:XRE family transcriptional regulator [Bacillota bacterium]